MRANLKARLRAFRRKEDGAAAVEFALIALPFFTLLFAIIELAMVFFASVTLDSATDGVGRKIRTGEFQTTGTPSAAAFKAAICSRMIWLEASCNANLRVDVRAFALFADVKDAPPPTVPGSGGVGQINPANNCFNPGGPTNIVLVRTFYEWTLFTPFLDRSLVNVGNNKRLLTSVGIFKNEPYGAVQTGNLGC